MKERVKEGTGGGEECVGRRAGLQEMKLAARQAGPRHSISSCTCRDARRAGPGRAGPGRSARNTAGTGAGARAGAGASAGAGAGAGAGASAGAGAGAGAGVGARTVVSILRRRLRVRL